MGLTVLPPGRQEAASEWSGAAIALREVCEAVGLGNGSTPGSLVATSRAIRTPASIACLGDSITAFSSTVDDVSVPKNRSYNNVGYMTWVNNYLRQGLYHDHDLNFGVSGNTSEMCLARVGDVIAAAPDICIVLAGTNDAWTSWPASRTTAALQSIYDALVGAGVLVVAVPIPPRSYWSALSPEKITTQRLVVYSVNRWIREYCRTNRGVLLADISGEITDQSNATGDPLVNIMHDGLHPSSYGAAVIGKRIAATIEAAVPVGAPILPEHKIDAYNATNNPSGNLLSNGTMDGTSGSPGTNVTGTVATGWLASRSAGTAHTGGTVVASKEARTDGVDGEWQVLTFTGLTGGSHSPYSLQMEVSGSSGSYAQGDVIEAECEVDVSGAEFLSTVRLIVWEYDAAVAIVGDSSSGDAQPGYFMPETWAGVLKTMPAEISEPVAATSKIRLRVDVYARGDLGASGVVKIGRVDLRKVIS